jgi:hypothetical protein
MPYLKSNWESLPPLDEFGRFSFGEIFTIPDLTLTQAPGTKGCYLHGEAPQRDVAGSWDPIFRLTPTVCDSLPRACLQWPWSTCRGCRSWSWCAARPP